MHTQMVGEEFDVIVIGSGTSGATVARELTKLNKRVLILEKGTNKPLKETFMGLASIVNEVSVGHKLASMRAVTTGGSSALYAAIAEEPPLDKFLELGIDLSQELKEVKAELPVAVLSDDLISPQAHRLKESALDLGFAWQKSMMLIDQSKCANGYSYDAKWKAKSYVYEAIDGGAALINNATVKKVLIEDGSAIGVEYKCGREVKNVYAKKIVLAAGVLATPKILVDSKVIDFENSGFYCNPGFIIFGKISGLKGKDNFVGCMSAEVEDGIVIGDANLSRTFYQIMMLVSLKFPRLFSFSDSIAIGGMIIDGLGGSVNNNGTFQKTLTSNDQEKLKSAERIASRIIKNAGAKSLFYCGPDAGNIGGFLKIPNHIDKNMESKVRGLYVCDGSVIPDSVRVYPTLTLVCLGKYLAKHLSSLV